MSLHERRVCPGEADLGRSVRQQPNSAVWAHLWTSGRLRNIVFAMTEDEIDQLRHDAANAGQKLDAAQTMVLRAIAAVELKDDVEAKRILRGLLAALKGEDG